MYTYVYIHIYIYIYLSLLYIYMVYLFAHLTNRGPHTIWKRQRTMYLLRERSFERALRVTLRIWRGLERWARSQAMFTAMPFARSSFRSPGQNLIFYSRHVYSENIIYASPSPVYAQVLTFLIRSVACLFRAFRMCEMLAGVVLCSPKNNQTQLPLHMDGC